MVNFAGYAKKESPRWFSALIYILGFFIAVTAILGISYLGQWMGTLTEEVTEEPAAFPTTTTIVVTAAAKVPVLKAETTPETSVAEGDISIEKIVVTSGIENGRPVDALDKVSAAKLESLYCYTRIGRVVVPQKIKHVWIDPSGRVYAEVMLDASKPSVDTWSYVSLSRLKRGVWEVQVRKASGEIVARSGFTVY